MRVLIVDDEGPARSRLRRLLEGMPEHEVVGEAANGRDALLASEAYKAQVVLMDIRMPGLDGIEAARHLAELEEPPAIIFTTAFDEYALAAFDAQAVGYLLKPVRAEKLAQALSRAARPTRPQLAALQASQDSPEFSRRSHICARVRDRLKLIPVEEILFFRADQKYVNVRHLEGEVLIDESLKSLETEFSPDVFMRVHRNALVSVAHLEGLRNTEDGYSIVLRNCAEELPISRRHAAPLRKMLRGKS